MAKTCTLCKGTGNAGHSGHVDEYGCIACGGAGQVYWYTPIVTLVILATGAFGIGWILSVN